MTAAEVVPAAHTSSELEQVDPSQREAAVTAYLSQARDQIAHALEMSGPAAVAALKAEIATAAEATRQLGLSKEIQADAQEMVRRAEYALGKAIRAGQEAGEVRTSGQTATHYSSAGLRRGATLADGAVPVENSSVGISPREFLPNGQEMSDVYALSDDVTEEQFEGALTEARGEGNLSRANVVRKVQGVKNDGPTPAEKLAKIRELAPRGYTSGQIADELGLSESYVRDRARELDIEITADKVLARTHRVRIDHNHIVNHLAMTLEGLAEGLDRIDFDALDETQMKHWADSLTNSTRALNRFVKQIKEKTQ